MRPVSDLVYEFDEGGLPARAYKRCSADELGLTEGWLQRAISEDPEVVIGACREGDLTDEEWHLWATEFRTDAGPVDVLLVSDSGRVGVVETKRAGNPDSRRRVIAQVVDYLAALADAIRSHAPEIPTALVDTVDPHADVLRSVEEGDVLLIVASDEISPRLARLGQTLLGNHLVKPWDLALVDVAIYRPSGIGTSRRHIVVPQLVGMVKAEMRQVVRVIVEGEDPQARIEVETTDTGLLGVAVRDETSFLRRMKLEDAPPSTVGLAERLFALASQYSPEELSLAWGRGRIMGSVTLKLRGDGMLELYAYGGVRFRPHHITRGLGNELGAEYIAQLERLFPRTASMSYPRVNAALVAEKSDDLAALLERVVTQSLGPAPAAPEVVD